MPTGLLTPTHILILLIVVLIILGPKRLPQAGHALGRSIHEFKAGITGRQSTEIETPAAAPDPSLAEHHPTTRNANQTVR